MVKKNQKTRKIADALGASRTVRVGKRWNWKMASPAEKKLCVCGTAEKHLPHCPYNEVGVDFSDMQGVLKQLERDFMAEGEPRDPKRIPVILKRLGKIWKENPDLRLAQLILNVFVTGGPGAPYGRIYAVEDKELLSIMEKVYSKKNRK